jgi:hypothetical protein
MRMIRRIAALAILAGLLGLPVLGAARPDPCCAGDSPCAPGAAPCESLGPAPCCPADHGAAGASDSRASGASAVCGLPASQLLAFERAPRETFDRLALPAAASPLRLSVVLRI